jgi:hypothetical protein
VTNHKRKPLRKINFVIGWAMLLSAVADFKEAGHVSSIGWTWALYVTGVFMAITATGPLSAAFGE